MKKSNLTIEKILDPSLFSVQEIGWIYSFFDYATNLKKHKNKDEFLKMYNEYCSLVHNKQLVKELNQAFFDESGISLYVEIKQAQNKQ